MRYLVLADIHGNLEALEAVLSDAGDFDAVLCLGDLVGYGPNPNECVEVVRQLPQLTSLAGNHDWAALGKIDASSFNSFARKAVEWTDERLDPEIRAYLDSLEPKLECEEFALAHGSPRDPIWEYLEVESQGPENFREFHADFCLVGHTHVPRIFVETPNGNGGTIQVTMPEADHCLQIGRGKRHIINPGGIGQPRNGDPRAAYGVLDTEEATFMFRRVPYDVGTTQQKIHDAGLPAALASRLRLGI
jgi:diadenosine tetraphosphatase ApaH/serine/threonine PP2A family protein phosphatase